MTEADLYPLLSQFGLLPNQSPVARPRLSKADRRQLARVRRRYGKELEGAALMRADVLNMTRGLARPRIAAELVAEGHTEAAYLLLFNNDQLALLMAWRDAVTETGSSSVGGEDQSTS